MHLLNQFVMVKEPLEFDGDISYEGFPFYAGTFVLSNTFTLSKKERVNLIIFIYRYRNLLYMNWKLMAILWKRVLLLLMYGM